MAKHTTTHRAPAKTKAAKVKKSKDSILRDHSLDQLVHGKRKRQPTQRAIEAQALLKPSKKIKKQPAKKIKRMGTMQRTAKEALELLSNDAPKPRKSVDKTPVKVTPIAKSASKSKAVSRSRSRSASKAHKKAGKSRSKSAKKGTKKTSKHTTPIKRTKTMAQTIKDGNKLLGLVDDESENSEDEEVHADDHDAAHDSHHGSRSTTPAKGGAHAKAGSGKKKAGGGMHRTKTMAQTLKEGNKFLQQKGRSSSGKKK